MTAIAIQRPCDTVPFFQGAVPAVPRPQNGPRMAER